MTGQQPPAVASDASPEPSARDRLVAAIDAAYPTWQDGAMLTRAYAATAERIGGFPPDPFPTLGEWLLRQPSVIAAISLLFLEHLEAHPEAEA